MTSDDRHDPVEEALRDALSSQADSVHPAGDGLTRIQHRVAARRARLRWLRPALAVGCAVVVAGAGIGAYTAVGNSGGTQTVTPASPSDTPTPSDTPSSAPVADHGFPEQAFFPFTTAADEQAWEQDAAGGHMPWIADPVGVASSWVQNYLQQPDVTEVVDKTVDGATADVTLGRKVAGSGDVQPVTVVHLVKFREAWLVVGAGDPTSQLAIDSPAPDTVISSPVTVSGPGFGADEAADVQVRDATSVTMFGHASTGSFGAGSTGWSASVSFSGTTDTVGALVVVEDSSADGGPARITAQKVRFAAASTPAGIPAYFYGVKDNRVTKFAAGGGAAVTYLTEPQDGVTVTDPQLAGDSVYFLAASGACGATLQQVVTGGGAPGEVATADKGYTISGYAISPDTDKVAYFETGCDGNAGQGKLVFLDRRTQQTRAIAFASEPPAVEGDPSWEPDGIHVDAFVKTGMQGYLARYDSTSDTSPTPDANACPALDVNSGLPRALEVDGDGTLWVATQTGRSIQVVRCANGKADVAFSLPGNDIPADLDVTSTGSAVLVTDTDGKVWRWDGSGSAHQLTPDRPLTFVTW